MASLGAGIYLNEDWDFAVDVSGDLRTTTEIKELQKDVALNVAESLQDDLGKPITNQTAKEIRISTKNVLLSDPRLGTIRNIEVNRVRQTNEFEVVASADTIDGPFDLVFEVEL